MKITQIWGRATIEQIDYSRGVIYTLTENCDVLEFTWAGFLKLDVLDEIYFNPSTGEIHPRHYATGVEALRLFQEQLIGGN